MPARAAAARRAVVVVHHMRTLDGTRVHRDGASAACAAASHTEQLRDLLGAQLSLQVVDELLRLVEADRQLPRLFAQDARFLSQDGSLTDELLLLGVELRVFPAELKDQLLIGERLTAQRRVPRRELVERSRVDEKVEHAEPA